MERALILIALVGLAAGEAVAATRPNVVILLADDSGWGDYGYHGNTNLATPNLDVLARSGVVLDRFYVCAVCTPTRAEMLTGRYHPRGGVRRSPPGNYPWPALQLRELSYPEFRSGGGG